MVTQSSSDDAFCVQAGALQFVGCQLCRSELGSEVQFFSGRTGPELQRAAGFRREGSVWSSGESTLQPEDSEVGQQGCHAVYMQPLFISLNFKCFLLKKLLH